MHIDGNAPIDDKRLYNRVQENDKSKNVEGKEGSQKSESEKDKVSLSGKAQVVNDFKAMIDGMPDVRRDRVDAIKKAIDAGSYNFDSAKIAERIIAEEM